jgi:hypothetical protein
MYIDMTAATADDKEGLLGREFREIDVRGLTCGEGALRLDARIEGQAVTLVGDPQKALAVYLGGRADRPETLQ